MVEIEQGPLRPPSEARSLLIRLVRNCPWNKCLFCPAYKGEKFSLRCEKEILAEIALLAAEPGAEAVRTVFLQDADALIMPAEPLAAVLRAVRRAFPGLERVTAYARSATLCLREVGALKVLKEAGLTRIHVGVESGSDETLAFVKKGVTAAGQLEGCARVKAAGLELCCYVMPGLGGRRLSGRHAVETGRLIAQIEPDHLRLRTCFVLEGTPLAAELAAGRFEPLGEEEIVRELRTFLSELSKTRTELISDHRINLLFELQGSLPRDHARLLAIIDRFLALGPEDKDLFIAGRRLGLIRSMDDLYKPGALDLIKQYKHQYVPANPVPRGLLF